MSETSNSYRDSPLMVLESMRRRRLQTSISSCGQPLAGFFSAGSNHYNENTRNCRLREFKIYEVLYHMRTGMHDTRPQDGLSARGTCSAASPHQQYEYTSSLARKPNVIDEPRPVDYYDLSSCKLIVQ
jgi:hypothetical protein